MSLLAPTQLIVLIIKKMTRMKTGEKRKYVIPLRKDYLKAPRWRRSKRAIKTIHNYILRHTKIPNIRLSKWVNEEIWKHGGKNPPSKVEVEVKVETRKVDDKKTKKKIDIPFAIVELSTLPERAKRLMKREEENLKKFKEGKKLKKKGEPKEKKESLKEKVSKKIKKKPKKKKKTKSAKELAKELEKKKEEKEKKKQKKKAKVTKQQEMKMHK